MTITQMKNTKKDQTIVMIIETNIMNGMGIGEDHQTNFYKIIM
jgi:hypothetical protein